MTGPDRGERVTHAARDGARERADVLEPERDLRLDTPQHHLVLRVLEHRRHRARELGGARVTRVVAGDLDAALEAAAVEPRHEAGERPQQRRLARAGRAEQQDDLPRLDRQAYPVQRRRCARVREAEPIHRR